MAIVLLSDLNSKTIINKDVANNLTTSSDGYVLDARQGKALNDKITPTSVTLTKQQTSITLNTATAYKFGNIIIVYVHFTTNANISAYANLVSFGSTAARVSGIFPLFSGAMTPHTDKSVYFDNGNTNIRASTAIPSGTYRFTAIVMI